MPPLPPSRAASASRCAWIPVACLVAIILAGAALRWRLIDIPLERDEGEYGAMAQVILRGEAPYAGAHNMKLPGVFYAYALILKFGESAAAIRWGLIAVTSVSTVLVYRLGRRWFDAAVGVIAALIFTQSTLSASLLGFSANAEHFLVLPMLGGWLVLPETVRGLIRQAFVAGALFGLAVLMKQHAVAFVVAAGGWFVLGGIRHDGWRTAVRGGAVFGLGVLAPYLVTVIYLAARGAFDEFWFWTVTYPRHYVAVPTLEQGWNSLTFTAGQIITAQWPMLVAAIAGVASFAGNAGVRRRSGTLAALTIGSALSVCPGLFFRSHYFLMAVPCMALWAAVGISALAHRFGRGKKREVAGDSGSNSFAAPFVAVCATAAALAVGGSVWIERNYLFRLTPQQISRWYYGANPFPESPVIAKYLQEHTSDDDRIAVVGSEPQIYFYSGRRSAAKLLYTYPLMEPQPHALTMQRDMARQIDAADPRYLVYVTTNTSWLQRPDSPREIFDWLNRTIQERYRLVGVVDIQDRDRTIFRWDEDAIGYQPQSESVVFVFVRKGEK